MCSAPASLPLLAEDFSITSLPENFFQDAFHTEGEQLSTPWLPPATVSLNELAYDNTPFLTPYASTVPDTSPLPMYPTSLRLSPFPFQNHYAGASLGSEFAVDQSSLPARPRSSPSTFFGPRVEDLVWGGNALRIKQSDFFPSYSNPEVHAPSPRRLFPLLAPHPPDPATLFAQKRKREDDEYESQAKRARSTSVSLQPQDLTEDERFLLHLKEEENLPWKDIALRFQTDLGKTYQVPALQMRFKRLRERMRTWTDADVNALQQAHEYWERCKFEIIGAKMVDFGASEKWPARLCARKWVELHPGQDDARRASVYRTTPSPRLDPMIARTTPYMS